MVIFHNMHSCPSKHGIHKISSLSGNYENNLHIRLTLDFLVIFPNVSNTVRHIGCLDFRIIKSVSINCLQRIGERDFILNIRLIERIFPYRGQALWQLNGMQERQLALSQQTGRNTCDSCCTRHVDSESILQQADSCPVISTPTDLQRSLWG